MARTKRATTPDPFAYCTPLERACVELLHASEVPLDLAAIHAAVKDVAGGAGPFGPWSALTVQDCALRVLVIGGHAVQVGDLWARPAA